MDELEIGCQLELAVDLVSVVELGLFLPAGGLVAEIGIAIAVGVDARRVGAEIGTGAQRAERDTETVGGATPIAAGQFGADGRARSNFTLPLS
jgi:hypothetical protein